MKLNLIQTKLVGLTAELDLKTREYRRLCEKLEKLKKENIDENSPLLLELKQLFEKNHEEIANINMQIKELKNEAELLEKKTMEEYDPSNLFKKKQKNNSNNINNVTSIEKYKKALFSKIISKIKMIFHK